MKTTKILSVMLLFVATAFVGEVNAQSAGEQLDQYYYYAYAYAGDDYNSIDKEKVIISPLLYKDKSDCSPLSFSKEQIAEQFGEIIKANYNYDYIDYNTTLLQRIYYTKTEALKEYREFKSNYSSIKLIENFEYLCD